MASRTTVTNVILTKKTQEGLQELRTKTHECLVVLNKGGTLDTELDNIRAAAKNVADTLTVLLSNDKTSGSIAYMITNAIDNLRDAIENEETPDTIGNRVKTLEDTVAQVQGWIDKGVADAKQYTDEKLGFQDYLDFTTVKAYVDSKEYELKEQLGGALHYRGARGRRSELDNIPMEERMVGDVYHVSIDDSSGSDFVSNSEFAWNGTEWEELGSIVDLSNYSTLEQTENIGAAAQRYADQQLALYKMVNDMAVERAQATADQANSSLDAYKETNDTAVEYAQKTADDAQEDLNRYKESNDNTVSEFKREFGDYKSKNDNTVEKKARLFVSENQPEELTEYDLWAHIVNISSPEPPREEPEESEEPREEPEEPEPEDEHQPSEEEEDG